MIKQGTTPTHTFDLPDGVDASDVTTYKVIYTQSGETIITITGTTVSADPLSVTLTQSQTLALIPDTTVEIEVIILTADGCERSLLARDMVQKSLLQEVIS